MSTETTSFTKMIRGLSNVSLRPEDRYSLPISQLVVSEFQPRKQINQEELEALAQSIQQNGLINPITVRGTNRSDVYEILAGERRYRAALLLHWDEIPVVIKQADDRTARAIALVENLQRTDLNPVEEAQGYQALLQQHAMTHDQVAELVGKSRPSITNALRLLELPPAVLASLAAGTLSVGHAKLLVPLAKELQMSLAEKVLQKRLSVRSLEGLVRSAVLGEAASFVLRKPKVVDKLDASLAVKVREALKQRLGVDVEVVVGEKNQITLTPQELIRLLQIL
jgi:ParB family chromosome partitioning protein